MLQNKLYRDKIVTFPCIKSLLHKYGTSTFHLQAYIYFWRASLLLYAHKLRIINKQKLSNFFRLNSHQCVEKLRLTLKSIEFGG